MPVATEFKLDGRFRKQAKGVFEKYNFEVGVLDDAPHKIARNKKYGLKVYAGGPARKTGLKNSTQNISDVSEHVRKKLGINLYQAPFESRKNADVRKFIKSFFDLCAGRTQKRQCENLLQAVVRNPILRGDYGSNSPAAIKNKGFNRFLIDTAQLFQAIKARVTPRAAK